MKEFKGHLYFRRCHICQSITERTGKPVSHCHHCKKPMAPFCFFNEWEVSIHSDDQLRPREFSEEGVDPLHPVRGLSAYW